ncbi:MAG TPA: hypothetical protein VGM29_07880 [Polyangiaceae bacterium]
MRRFGILCLGLALASVTTNARAEGTAESAPDGTPDSNTAEARRHFKLGTKLYQDGNYSGALAEFEAAYAQKPGPGSLQNVALCQKALFRYRAAATTLEQLLAKHGSEMSADEQQTVHAAIDELSALVGSIVVNVEPSDAKVTLDGRPATAAELHSGIEVDIGEHTLVAEALGYARLSRTLSVASGQKKLPVELKLKPTDGFLNVIAVDPKAAIAVDGETRAFHEWHGSVTPGSDHLVQVFREGYDTFETTVNVALGKVVEVRADLGAPVNAAAVDETPPPPGAMPKPPPRRAPRGFYGLLTLGVAGLRHKPLELTAPGGKTPTLGTLDVRAGYRPFAQLAIELMLATASVHVDDATAPNSTTPRAYTLNSVHFGPNARYLSPGKTIRFTGTAGFGLVHHDLKLDQGANTTSERGGSSGAFDPYFSFEAGAQLIFGHVLAGIEATLLIDGVSNFNSNEHAIEDKKPFAGAGAVALAGLGIHVGYAFW